jgi:cold shock protein
MSFASIIDHIKTIEAAAPPAAHRPRRRREPEKSGVVQFYTNSAGYGFIKCDQSGKDSFVHATELRRAGIELLQPGDKVRFDLKKARKGEEATNLAEAA